MLAYQIIGQVNGDGGLLAEGIAPDDVVDGVLTVMQALGLKCYVWPESDQSVTVCLTTMLGGRFNEALGEAS